MNTLKNEHDGRSSRHEPRRQDLLEAAVEYVFEHGLSALSIRPLAAALGISHRTLLYHFDSKEELIVEILQEVRARERSLFALRSSDEDSLVDFVQEAFRRFTSSAHEQYFRLFFEVYGLALQDRALYGSFLEGVVSDWLPIIEEMLIHDGCSPERAPAIATLVLSSVRGLQLDLLTTHDHVRIASTFEAFITTLRSLLRNS